MRRSLSFIFFTTVATVFLPSIFAFSQSTAPAAPAAPAPADFPSYIVTPSEDLNPYDLSTMQKSTETDYRDGTGTLGTTTQRSSNIAVNEALQKSREERQKAAEEAKAKSAVNPEEADSEQIPSPEELAPAEGPQLGDAAKDLETPGVRGGLFTWTDEQGVLHATNDIGQVPIEYQLKAIESSNSVDLNKDNTNKKRNNN